jgi:hypothetical protein
MFSDPIPNLVSRSTSDMFSLRFDYIGLIHIDLAWNMHIA